MTEQAGAAAGDGIWATWKAAPVPARALLLGVFINRLGGFFQTFLVLFLSHRGFSKWEAGFALTVYGVGSLAGVLAGGALSDRLGPRLATIVSMLGTAVLLLVILYVGPYWAVLVAVALCGLVNQLCRPAAATLLSELTTPERQVMMFALYRWALNLGTTAAPLLAYLFISISYSVLFWAEAVAAVLYAGIAAVWLPRREPPEPAAAAAAGDRPASGYAAMLRDRRYLLYLLAMLVNSTVYIQYISTLPLTMKDAGLATIWYSGVVALNGFLVITCELLVTKVIQRWPIKVTMATGFALLGGGLSLYALPWGVAIFFIGCLIWTMAEMVGGPTMFAYPGIAAPEPLRGRYIASMQLMFNLGGAVGPGLGVFLYDAIGLNVWWCCGLASLVALVLAVSSMVTPAAVTADAAATDAGADAALLQAAATAELAVSDEAVQPIAAPLSTRGEHIAAPESAISAEDSLLGSTEGR
ncbi:MAG TPA: MFS transporter [Jatrophihabitans sp.]|nr:MFS transporter [Jatrophihabitans sp.]